jgi:hypothetical protein
LTTAVPRIPLLAGTRFVVASAPDDAVVLRPPPPGAAIADVGAAVRDALRFPLEGRPLEALTTPSGRVTIVIEPPALPLPGAAADPRQLALAAVVSELERLGIHTARQTILVAGGLARKLAQRELEGLVTPDLARRFRGTVTVHDAEAPELVEIGAADETPIRVNPALVETDLVIVVTAAETVLNGGPGALLAACGSEALRPDGAASLLETAGSPGWSLALAAERALAGRVALAGCSLVLNNPTLGGPARGYPYEEEAVERVVRSPLRHLFGAFPGGVRQSLLRSLPLELTVAGVYAGPPAIAHAEALLRAVELRRTELEGSLDALVVGIPRLTPYLPRERPNPLLVAYLGLGFVLRLWRDERPIADGGTAILVHRLHRHFGHGAQLPYRTLFNALRDGRGPSELAAAEQAAGADDRALADYRSGRSAHALLPFRDWDGVRASQEHLGAVVVAGCRDAAAARQLGFVPAHSLPVALEMAQGRGAERIGFLLSPPYVPLRPRR